MATSIPTDTQENKQFDDLLSNLQFIIQTHSHSQRALAKMVSLNVVAELDAGMSYGTAFIRPTYGWKGLHSKHRTAEPQFQDTNQASG